MLEAGFFMILTLNHGAYHIDNLADMKRQFFKKNYAGLS